LTRKLEVAEEQVTLPSLPPPPSPGLITPLQLRNLSKEREISVTTLSQFKSEKSRELGELQTSSHKKDVDLKNLKKKCSSSSPRLTPSLPLSLPDHRVIELESKLQSTVNENSASKILHDQVSDPTLSVPPSLLSFAPLPPTLPL
jgi:hypothetical protein